MSRRLFILAIYLTFIFFPYAIFSDDFSHDFTPSSIANPIEHTMEFSLFGYLDLKMHDWISTQDYQNIWVVGEYDRSCAISSFEKKANYLIGSDLLQILLTKTSISNAFQEEIMSNIMRP